MGVLLDVDVHVDRHEAIDIDRVRAVGHRLPLSFVGKLVQCAFAINSCSSSASRSLTMTSSSTSRELVTDAVDQHRHELRRQVRRLERLPPLHHRRSEVVEHVRQPARSAGEVLVDERAEQRPAEPGAGTRSRRRCRRRSPRLLDQAVRLSPERRLEPVGDVARKFHPHPDRRLADRSVELDGCVRPPPLM